MIHCKYNANIRGLVSYNFHERARSIGPNIYIIQLDWEMGTKAKQEKKSKLLNGSEKEQGNNSTYSTTPE